MCFLGPRQFDDLAQAPGAAIGDIDPATCTLHDFPGDGQTKSGAANILPAGAIGAKERLEHAIEEFGQGVPARHLR